MRHHTGQELERLRRVHPAWEIWYVPRATAPLLWCARRYDDHKNVVHGESPQELSEAIGRAGRERP